MKCCAKCFGDRGLERQIIPLHADGTGTCSYCRSGDVSLVPPSILVDYFSLLLSAYRADDEGYPLVYWLREDWRLFPTMDDAHAKELLAEIFDDGELVRRKFLPSVDASSDRLGEWEKLRDELMFHNRFFPQTDIDQERLEDLLSSLNIGDGDVPRIWYRARIQTALVSFNVADMGAPPKHLATHGRANPAGIPYLYLNSAPRGAVSETRPHTGDIVCVAKFETESLRLVDLRDPRRVVSPFLLDVSDIVRLRNDLPFLERLGDELTRPVLPQAAAFEYTPSQYLCEFVKKCGYDGVVYRSALGESLNLALFRPEAARASSVEKYKVSRVSVETMAEVS